MICPFCKAEGEKSTLSVGGTSSTLLAYSTGAYDEDGRWMPARDPNWHTTGYTCSRGHRYTVKRHEGAPDEVQLIGGPQPNPPLPPYSLTE